MRLQNEVLEPCSTFRPEINAVRAAAQRISEISVKTPLKESSTYSRRFSARILFKREDLQPVRSYKLRGAYNKISSLSADELERGVICASAGNHAQGVAMACNKLGVNGVIYMPVTTPSQKVEQTRWFGGKWVEVVLEGDSFDDAQKKAMARAELEGLVFVHPFEDPKVIEGQATIGLEILEQTEVPVDYILVPVGGGGLSAGVASVVKELSPGTKIIGVEPAGAASMGAALKAGKVVELGQIDKFVDGAAVQRVGQLNFDLCKELLDGMIQVPEGRICQTILDLYNKDAIVVEPAGALAISALQDIKRDIIGKNVVCLVSGSNNDITRTPEINERALLYSGRKHYFVVKFPQRKGALKEFLAEVLGPGDDISLFEYRKKHSRENAPALVGIELSDPSDFEPLVERMKSRNFFQQYLNEEPDLFQLLT